MARFVVNSVGDDGDFDLFDDVCDVDPDTPEEQCTLRAAIENANRFPDSDTIEFRIGPGSRTITLQSALETIRHPVTIDGTTEEGYAGRPLIELDGSEIADEEADGLVIIAQDSRVRGLAIYSFGGSGIRLENGGRNRIESNFIGTNSSGRPGLDNLGNGVTIENAPDNTIGGTATAARNVISGNAGSGIAILGREATRNHVLGNLIGTDISGTRSLRNEFDGVTIEDAPGNTIGGVTPRARNVISGNGGDGVFISGSNATGNRVLGNLIGTEDGTATDFVIGRLGNEGDGVALVRAGRNTIGGVERGAANLIAANGQNGIRIVSNRRMMGNLVQGNGIGTTLSRDPTGIGTGTNLGNALHGIVLDDAPDNTIGGTGEAARNVISSNLLDGVRIVRGLATGNLVLGNYIGTDARGISPQGNGDNGVSIATAPGNTIGGAEPGDRNVIASNGENGVLIRGGGATGNRVLGNRIGTNAIGTVPLGNRIAGVAIEDTSGNTVGGANRESGNLISGNLGNGVSARNAQGVVVQGNHIGTDFTGTRALGNAGDGVNIVATSGITIGGAVGDTRNVIVANLADGIDVSGSADLLVQGNLIGIGADGALRLGNGGVGVRVAATTVLVRVGGAGTEARNIISDNGSHGIEVVRSPNVQVQGNRIGTDAAGNFGHGNAGVGIRISDATQAIIGGPAADDHNIIADSRSHGVEVLDTAGNTADTLLVQGNTIAGSGRDGVRAAGLADVRVLGNAITASLAQGIEVTSTGATGTLLVQGNVIADGGQDGVTASGLSSVQVQGNRIGTDAAGNLGHGNSGVGVRIANTPRSIVGGTTAGAGNMIAGSRSHGVEVIIDVPGLSGSVLVQGNTVVGSGAHGVTAAGVAIVQVLGNTVDANAGVGVQVVNAAQGVIGGVLGSDRNLITGSRSHGVEVTGSPGTLIRGNVIAASGLHGVSVAGSARVQVVGNLVGTDDGATPGRGNIGNGVSVSNSPDTTVGGTVAGTGNVITSNGFHGVEVAGSSNVVIQGNLIGVAPVAGSGTVARGNAGDGVRIDRSASGMIGGTEAGARNVIAANRGHGVLLDGTTGTVVQGNLVGTDVAGIRVLDAQDQPLGNALDGVSVRDAPDNLIGGTTEAAHNVIGGNRANGIGIFGRGARGNRVQGNAIGTDRAGRLGLGNGGSGVAIEDAAENTVGGASVGAGNLISTNRASGVAITGAGATGNLVRGNVLGAGAADRPDLGNLGDGVTIVNAARNAIVENIISGNGSRGVLIAGPDARANRVQGDVIGLDPSGTRRLGNLGAGVTITLAPETQLLSNVISGNDGEGVLISRATGTLVQDNRVGTDVTGSLAVGNGNTGIALDNTTGTTVGGNLVSANRSQGILITGRDGAGNRVWGNSIGTDASRTRSVDPLGQSLGNTQDGVLLFAAAGNSVGGPTAGDRNVIANNRANGVAISGAAAGGNVVLGNSIGTNEDGSLALGNGGNGVAIVDASANVVGENLISANRSNGVLILNPGATGNQVFGNRIGADRVHPGLGNIGNGVSIFNAPGNTVRSNVISGNEAHGVRVDGLSGGSRVVGNAVGTDLGGAADLGNALDGVSINDAPDTIIGEPVPGLGNAIRFNRLNGVELSGAATTRTRVRGNSILSNGSDGVRLVAAPGNHVQGNLILDNRSDGLRLADAADNSIGGPAAGDRNVISGNAGAGVELLGATTGTAVQGNFIGTDGTGSLALGNEIGVFLNDAVANVIGGLEPGARNLISGNRTAGIQVVRFRPDGRGNAVLGNSIGTDASGALAVPNRVGVFLDNAPNNTLGGNVVSGNSAAGIQALGRSATANWIVGNLIGVDAAGRGPLANEVGVLLGGSPQNTVGPDNVISGNRTSGVRIIGPDALGNVVQGNRIGTDPGGRRPILAAGAPEDSAEARQDQGVFLSEARGSVVVGNVLSGNLIGVQITGVTATGNVVQGNLVGTDVSGFDSVGNTIGVFLESAPGNTIGPGNVISGNRSSGVYLLGRNARGNVVRGNFIGTNREGGTNRRGGRSLPNTNGVFISDAPENTIGGRTAADRNVLSGNREAGVFIFGAEAVGNAVLRNFIGTDAGGRRRLGNGQYGVLLFNAPNNNVARRGPDRNVLRANGIGNFREFTGRPRPRGPLGTGGQRPRRRPS